MYVLLLGSLSDGCPRGRGLPCQPGLDQRELRDLLHSSSTPALAEDTLSQLHLVSSMADYSVYC